MLLFHFVKKIGGLMDSTYKIDDENIIKQGLPESVPGLPVYVGRHMVTPDGVEGIVLGEVDAFVLMYVRAGEVEALIEDATVKVSAHNGLVIKQGIRPDFKTIGISKAEIEIVAFSHTVVFDYGTTILAAKYRDPVIKSLTQQYIQFNCRTEPGIGVSRAMDDIYYLDIEKEYGYEIAIKGNLCKIWYLMSKLYSPIPAKDNSFRISNDEYRVKQAIAYVESHYADQITLEELADSIHISKSECCRCFKRVLNLTPIEYVVQYRIYTAAAVLDDPKTEIPSIAELAIKTGHNNISYFNKMFKRHMGSTPTEYRAEVLKRSNWVGGGTSI